MSILLKMVGLVGVLDGFYLLLRPRDWAALWSAVLQAMREHPDVSRWVGVLEVGISLALLRGGRRSRTRHGVIH